MQDKAVINIFYIKSVSHEHVYVKEVISSDKPTENY